MIAREMLARVKAMVGTRAAGIVGGTFHSVAYRFVRAHASALGLPARVGLLDPSDAADLLDVIREELGLAAQKRRFPRKATLADIHSRTVNAQRPLSQVLAESYHWCEEYLEELAASERATDAAARRGSITRP